MGSVELGVEVVHGVERASGKEAFAKIAYAPLDAPLLVGPRHCAGLGGKVVVTGEVEDPGVESYEVTLSLEDGALQVVVEDGTGDTAEGVEGGEVTPEEALGGLVEVEAGEERAAPRQRHEKAREGASGATGATDRDPPKGRPVHLGLLPRQDRQTEERLVPRGARTRDEAANGKYPAGVAALAQHLQEPRGA